MMSNRALAVALVAAGAGWLMMLLVLGSERMQFAVSGDVIGAFAKPIAMLSASGAAFLGALAVAFRTSLPRSDLARVLVIVLGLDIAITLAGIVLNGLELASAPTIFLVVAAGGLQFVAVALATSLATRVVLAER